MLTPCPSSWRSLGSAVAWQDSSGPAVLTISSPPKLPAPGRDRHVLGAPDEATALLRGGAAERTAPVGVCLEVGMCGDVDVCQEAGVCLEVGVCRDMGVCRQWACAGRDVGVCLEVGAVDMACLFLKQLHGASTPGGTGLLSAAASLRG